jgi:hypothetical protein
VKGFPKQTLEAVEGIAGRILGAALAVGAVLICFLQIDEIQKLSLADQIASWLLVVLICLMEGMYVVLILTTRTAAGIIPPMSEVAMRQPRMPKLLRPIAAIFWLGHFLFIIGLIYILRQSTGASISWLAWSGVYCLASLFDFLAYGYLLLFVTAFTKNDAPIKVLWQRRFWVSQIIAILSTFAPSFLPIHQVQ